MAVNINNTISRSVRCDSAVSRFSFVACSTWAAEQAKKNQNAASRRTPPTTHLSSPNCSKTRQSCLVRGVSDAVLGAVCSTRPTKQKPGPAIIPSTTNHSNINTSLNSGTHRQRTEKKSRSRSIRSTRANGESPSIALRSIIRRRSLLGIALGSQSQALARLLYFHNRPCPLLYLLVPAGVEDPPQLLARPAHAHAL